VLPIAGLAIVAALAGCGAKKADDVATSVSDSLLAQNPLEQTPGSVTPQEQYQPAPAPEPVTPAPAPRSTPPASKPAPRTAPAPAERPGLSLPSGTAFTISATTALSSETAQPGDAWTGTVKDNVVVGSGVPIPAGATVHGVVLAAEPAERGNRAYLVLAVRSIEIEGKSFDVAANADSIVAGSTRTRNVGAVAGGAAAGALLGKAIGGSSKGALIGGLIGGAAATGAVARSKGFQAVVKEGAEIPVTVTRSTTIRR
jgi:hypothetical protein